MAEDMNCENTTIYVDGPKRLPKVISGMFPRLRIHPCVRRMLTAPIMS